MEQQQLKGARAAAAAWDALTPEEREAATKKAEERQAAEAAALAARFWILPTLEDMKRLYDVAAQIAVVEQCDVLTDRNCDCYGTQMSDLLEEADEVFAEQDPEGYCDTSDVTSLQTMDEEERFEEWFRLRKEAIRALVFFAEGHIVLTWGRTRGVTSRRTSFGRMTARGVRWRRWVAWSALSRTPSRKCRRSASKSLSAPVP